MLIFLYFLKKFSRKRESYFCENANTKIFVSTLLVGELKSEGGRLKALCAGIRGVDPKLVEMILAEVVPQQSTGVRFQDIAGQDKVNRSLF
jgi:hypothetical protein